MGKTTQYTPGPWELEEEGRADIVGGPEKELLASAYEMFHDGLPGSHFANARLIASAPHMLQSLKVALAAIVNPECFDAETVVSAIRATIGKAEGGS